MYLSFHWLVVLTTYLGVNVTSSCVRSRCLTDVYNRHFDSCLLLLPHRVCFDIFTLNRILHFPSTCFTWTPFHLAVRSLPRILLDEQQKTRSSSESAGCEHDSVFCDCSGFAFLRMDFTPREEAQMLIGSTTNEVECRWVDVHVWRWYVIISASEWAWEDLLTQPEIAWNTCSLCLYGTFVSSAENTLTSGLLAPNSNSVVYKNTEPNLWLE